MVYKGSMPNVAVPAYPWLRDLRSIQHVHWGDRGFGRLDVVAAGQDLGHGIRLRGD